MVYNYNIGDDISKIIEGNNLPPVIYKYRDWNNELHKRILTENEIFFANPLDLDKQEELNFEFDEEITKSNKEKIRDNINNNCKIFCSTTSATNKKMWEVFANNNKGFCVGFDTKKLLTHLKNKNNLPVILRPNYIENKLFYSFKDAFNQTLKVIFNLGNHLEHENEIRFAKYSLTIKEEIPIEKYFGWMKEKFPNLQKEDIENFFKADHTIKEKIVLPIDCFKEIILGEYISQENENQIKNLVEKKFNHIKLQKINSQPQITDELFLIDI